MIAAGGLGTRVRDWSRYLPKEFYPVQGKPGIVHLLAEIAALGPARVVIVYHPYYEPFITWARQTLNRDGLAHYEQVARLPATALRELDDLDLVFIRQHGPYSDVTSVLNASAQLRDGDLYMAFADNLYPDSNPMEALRAAPPGSDAVLARPYAPGLAAHRGVIVCTERAGRQLMSGLVEKPGPERARELEDRYGVGRLWLLEAAPASHPASSAI